MARTTIPPELVAVNAIQGTLIADNSVTAVHIATNAISGTLVADNAITSTHIAQNNVTATQIAQNTITVTQMADSAIETAKINADAVTGAKIADNAIDSEHYTDGSIDTAHIADAQVTAAKIGANAVTLAKMASLTRGSILVGNSAADVAALAIGSANKILTSDGTDVIWSALNSGIDDNSNAVAMTIDSSEKVGIGDTSPFAKLHVEDTGWSSGAPYGAVAYIQGGAVNDLNWGHLLISQSGTTTDTGGRLAFGANGENPIAGIRAKYKGATYGDLAFLTRPSGGTNEERMVIDSSGKVGIGGSPARTFTVKSAAANATQISLVDNDSTNEVFAVGQQSDGDGFLTVKQDDGTTKVLFDASGDSYVAGGSFHVGSTDSVSSSAEVFSVYNTGTGHSRMVNSSDSYGTLYMHNESTTANTFQPFIIMQKGGGNRGNIGVRHTDSVLGISGQGGISLRTNSTSVQAATEALFIASDGNIGIGDDSPTANLHVKSNDVNHLLHLQRLDDVANRGEPYAELMIQNQEGSGGYNYGGLAIMADNQSHIRFQVGNSDDWAGSGGKRWQMRLGQAAGLDRLGIYSWTFGKDLHLWDSGGNQHINGTHASVQMYFGSQGGLFGGNASHNVRAASNLFMLNAGSSNGQFIFEVNGSSRGTITSSSSSGVFSDRDMKENIQDIEIGLSEVLNLKPRKFKYKSGTHETYGFIAQEVETVVPLAVDEIELPEVDPEANKTTLKTLDTTSLIAALVKSVQEQQTVIEDLKARIKTLEG